MHMVFILAPVLIIASFTDTNDYWLSPPPFNFYSQKNTISLVEASLKFHPLDYIVLIMYLLSKVFNCAFIK